MFEYSEKDQIFDINFSDTKNIGYIQVFRPDSRSVCRVRILYPALVLCIVFFSFPCSLVCDNYNLLAHVYKN